MEEIFKEIEKEYEKKCEKYRNAKTFDDIGTPPIPPILFGFEMESKEYEFRKKYWKKQSQVWQENFMRIKNEELIPFKASDIVGVM